MKKTTLTFAALAAAAASFASAENIGSQGAFPGLQEVQYQGVKLSAKEDDRVKFIYVADSVTAAPPAADNPMAAPATPAAAIETTPAEPLPQDSSPLQP
ncbi:MULTISPECIES: hypothetical protein [unclassified Neisseria]|uniref:hypothetical protein n=1 Tax=unclassified Neisseria TaxID=2623750 RepID=UPI001072A0C1|nr:MULTISPECIES: hypothetical protein [unclassified Neisseria]MBF0804847.1 hypothetical protein [Neisseria sp. 19428wB4_WF04]TFU39440.1 hypothetical protein E4T99_11065 [Neisseria sp. WF04]